MRIPPIALAIALIVAACSSGQADLDRATASSSTSVAPSSTTVSSSTSTTLPAGPYRFSAPFAPASSAIELAERLNADEATIRSTTDAREAAEAGHRSQVSYRQLNSTPEWHEDVFAILDPQWRPVVEANLEASSELSGLFPRGFPDELPAWEIVPPAPADVLVGYYKEAAGEFGFDWTYLAAINLVETRMGRIRGTSTAGAQGPMQFIPTSWEIYGNGGDINDNRDAIFAAARHLVGRGGNPFDIDKALFGYNPSDHYVTAVGAYARIMQADAAAYRGFHAWQVYYTTSIGEFFLPVGYLENERIPAIDYETRPVVPGPAVDI